LVSDFHCHFSAVTLNASLGGDLGTHPESHEYAVILTGRI